MRSLDSIFAGYHGSEMKLSACSGHCFPLVSFLIDQLHRDPTGALALAGRDHFARDTEAVEGEIDVLTRGTAVCFPIDQKLDLRGLEAPPRRRVNLQHVLPLLVQRQEVVAVGWSAFCPLFQSSVFGIPTSNKIVTFSGFINGN